MNKTLTLDCKTYLIKLCIAFRVKDEARNQHSDGYVQACLYVVTVSFFLFL